MQRAEEAPTSWKQGGQENWIVDPQVKEGPCESRGSDSIGGRHSLTGEWGVYYFMLALCVNMLAITC